MKKIIILHGWTYSLEKWEHLVQLLKKEGYEVETLEIPGLTSKSDEVWNINKYIEWLNKQLTKYTEKVILVGHSNGGRIAVAYTNQYPNKVEKLVLIDSAGIYDKRLLPQIKRFIFGNLAKIGKKFTNSQTLKSLLYKLAREKDYQSATPNMQKTMSNLINTDLTPTLEQINVPTLIIWGEDDKITPISDARLMNKLIKNSKVEIIAGAKHSPFYTHPEQVINILKNDL